MTSNNSKVSNQALGKFFESEIESALKVLASDYGVFWHRMSDTGATGARSGLGSQPADYLIASAEKPILLEAKASFKHKSVSRGMLRPIQRNSVMRWAFNNMLNYYVLFWSFERNVVELWDGREMLANDTRRPDKERGLVAWASLGEPETWNPDPGGLIYVLNSALPLLSKEDRKSYVNNQFKKWGVNNEL